MRKVILFLAFLFVLASVKSSIVTASSISWDLVYPSVNESTAITTSKSDKSIVYASIRKWTDFDIIKSSNSGITWQTVKNNLPAGGADINAINVFGTDPNYVTISMWGTGGGVFLSENGGNTWDKIFDSQTPLAVAIDPIDKNVIYVGIGGDNSGQSGVYKTTDKGIGWQKFAILGNQNCSQITIDSKNRNILFATAGNSFFKTTDGGNTWANLSLPFTHGTNSIIDKSDSNIVYTGSYSPISGIFKSTDQGETWVNKNNGLTGNPWHISQDDNGWLYITSGNSNLWQSSNDADSWQNIKDTSWGNRSIWGNDASNRRILVSVEGLGIFYADMNIPPPPAPPKPNPVVFVPGLGGSWSTKGLLENNPTVQSDWSLTPFFMEDYKSLLSTLQKSGLEQDKNLFPFYYDWRQPVKQSGSWLNDYIKNVVMPKNPGQKINIIGHSLGGLVIRACMQQFTDCRNNIGRVITAGAPHTGAVDAYNLWAGGQITEKDLLRRSLEAILLHVNGKSASTKKDIVHQNIPSIRDILPTFNYIDGLNYAEMSVDDKNPFLESIGIDNFLTNLTTFSGNTKVTTRYLSVEAPNWFEQKMGLWIDGKPVSSRTGPGDELVLAESATLSGALKNEFFDTFHGGLVSSLPAQQEILNVFGLSSTPSAQTKATNGLAFILHSPASISVIDPSGSQTGVKVDDKFIFVENPSDGKYEIKITGTGIGHYDLDIGTFKSDDTAWQEISGSTNPNQIDSYTFDYYANNWQKNSVLDTDGNLHLKMAGEEFSDLNAKIANIITKINRRQFLPAAQNLEALYKQLMIRLAGTSDPTQRNNLKITAGYILQTYEGVTQNANLKMNMDKLKRDLTKAEDILGVQKDSTNPSLLAINYFDANDYLQQAIAAGNQSSLYQQFLLIRGVFPLLNVEED